MYPLARNLDAAPEVGQKRNSLTSKKTAPEATGSSPKLAEQYDRLLAVIMLDHRLLELFKGHCAELQYAHLVTLYEQITEAVHVFKEAFGSTVGDSDDDGSEGGGSAHAAADRERKKALVAGSPGGHADPVAARIDYEKLHVSLSSIAEQLSALQESNLVSRSRLDELSRLADKVRQQQQQQQQRARNRPHSQHGAPTFTNEHASRAFYVLCRVKQRLTGGMSRAISRFILAHDEDIEKYVSSVSNAELDKLDEVGSISDLALLRQLRHEAMSEKLQQLGIL